jgi:hypothetical protein
VSAISFRVSGALASSAKIASSPVPAEGSRTMSLGGQRCGLGGDKAECQRRRELLEVFRFLGAAGLRREPSGEADQHLERRRRRASA